MKKKIIRLTEQDLHNIINESVKRILKEQDDWDAHLQQDDDIPDDINVQFEDDDNIQGNNLYQEWYDEEDYDGKTGEPGMVRSYDIGTYYMSNAEEDAKESGYDNVAEYLSYWFNEIKPECPWYWQKIGSGYGYNGTTIFKEGGLVCKDICDQIMFDEYLMQAPKN